MILLTSDLDRTLIYSERMMARFPIQSSMVSVERKNGQDVSFMTERAIRLLKAFHRDHLFVPVTTRSLQQYQRIRLFQQDVQPAYAIAANGGVLLVNGEIDRTWGSLISQRIEDTSVPNEIVWTAFSKLRHDEWVFREFSVDGLFYMYQVDPEAIPQAEFTDFQKEIETLGWRFLLQGKKLYLMPICLTKDAAIAEIKKRVSFDWHAAAGDSKLDYAMLQQADQAFCPRHGDLYQTQSTHNTLNWLSNEGATFAEELFETMMKQVEALIETSLWE